MNYISGNLIELAKNGEFDIIVHGANCQNEMGAGIAKLIKQNFPQAYMADLKTTKSDKNKLGTITFATIIPTNLIVVNAYIQYHYKGSGDKVDYDAFRTCMKLIAKKFPRNKIGMPKIGSGLAGGDWNKIENIIKKELKDLDVTIVEYDGK